MLLAVLSCLCSCSTRNHVVQDQARSYGVTPAVAPEQQPAAVGPQHFTMGSTQQEVAAVMGTPTRVQKYEYSGREIWSYDFSTVTFAGGRVYEWNNFSGNLKVAYPHASPAQQHQSAGSLDPAVSARAGVDSTVSTVRATPSYYNTSSSSTPYQSVRGYVRRDGTYVQPHHRTRSDSTSSNNWSSSGNVNPFTGKRGYKKSGW